jgi:hypothetical protein
LMEALRASLKRTAGGAGAARASETSHPEPAPHAEPARREPVRTAGGATKLGERKPPKRVQKKAVAKKASSSR